MTVPRRLYLVVFALALVAVVAGGFYVRHHARVVEKAAAECDSPAPPPKPTAPAPNLPGFEVAAACGPGEGAKTPAEKKK